MEEEIKKVNGTWQGIPCNIKAVWGKNDNWEGHEFTAEERTALFNGEVIEFDAVSKAGKPYKAKGKLEKQKFTDNDGNEHEYVGFKLLIDEKFTCNYKGKEVLINRKWGNHYFTDEEINILKDGGTISFETVSKTKGTKYTAKGKIAEQKRDDGSTYIGFMPIFN